MSVEAYSPSAGRDRAVSVIIPVFNNYEGIRACLRALTRQTLNRELFEVIVVDNGSADDRHALLESEFKDQFCLRLVKESMRGSYAARNKGIREARGDILAFTDSDCSPESEWLESGMKALQENPNCGFVGGEVEQAFESKDAPNAAEIHDQNYFQQERNIAEKKFTPTANLFTRMDIMDRVGPFNADLFSGGDLEWCQRCERRGLHGVYASGARMKHKARATFQALLERDIRLLRGKFALGSRGLDPSFATTFTWIRCFRGLIPPVRFFYRSFFGEKKLTSLHLKLKFFAIGLGLRYALLFETVRLRIAYSFRRRSDGIK